MSVAAVAADEFAAYLLILGHGIRAFRPVTYVKLVVDSVTPLPVAAEGAAGIAVGSTVTGEDLTAYYHPEFVPAAGQTWWVRSAVGAWMAEDIVTPA